MTHIRLGSVRIRFGRKNLARWGFPRLIIGGLSIWSRSSNGDRILASYHPRESTTWHWSLSISKPNRDMWTAKARAGRAKLFADGNPYATKPSWRDRFAIFTGCPRGQWHDYLRMPFGRSLVIARQDYHKPKRARVSGSC